MGRLYRGPGFFRCHTWCGLAGTRCWDLCSSRITCCASCGVLTPWRCGARTPLYRQWGGVFWGVGNEGSLPFVVGWGLFFWEGYLFDFFRGVGNAGARFIRGLGYEAQVARFVVGTGLGGQYKVFFARVFQRDATRATSGEVFFDDGCDAYFLYNLWGSFDVGQLGYYRVSGANVCTFFLWGFVDLGYFLCRGAYNGGYGVVAFAGYGTLTSFGFVVIVGGGQRYGSTGPRVGQTIVFGYNAGYLFNFCHVNEIGGHRAKSYARWYGIFVALINYAIFAGQGAHVNYACGCVGIQVSS